MSEQDAPREVWIDNDVEHGRTASLTKTWETDVLYIRADLAPGAQPSSAQVRREPRELDRALRSYGEGRISTGKLRELIAEWAAGKPLSTFAEPQGDESFGASARERRLAEALVSMCQKYEPKTEEELAAFVQAKRVLASPDAPRADPEARHARVREAALAVVAAHSTRVRLPSIANKSAEIIAVAALRAALETP